MNATHIEECKRDQQPNVPPRVAVKDVEVQLQELVRRPRAAELARSALRGVGEVPAGVAHVRRHVLATSKSSRWVDGDIFYRRAGDGVVANHLTKESLDEIRVGREPVHPLPPAEEAVRLENAVAE